MRAATLSAIRGDLAGLGLVDAGAGGLAGVVLVEAGAGLPHSAPATTGGCASSACTCASSCRTSRSRSSSSCRSAAAARASHSSSSWRRTSALFFNLRCTASSRCLHLSCSSFSVSILRCSTRDSLYISFSFSNCRGSGHWE